MRHRQKNSYIPDCRWFLLLAFIFFQSGFSQQVRTGKAGVPGTWHVIGTTQARFTADHDGIVVVPPFNNFRMVKIKVTGAPLRMIKMQVTYGSGVPDNLPISMYIPEGGTSRPIDLRGVGKRIIKRIDFWYDTRGAGRGRANVTVFGMK